MMLAVTMITHVLGEEMRTGDGLQVEAVGPAEAHFRPGGMRVLPYFQHLPAFAPELLVLAMAALVAFRCSRVQAEPTKVTPELRRSASGSSVASTPSSGGPKRAGALAK